MKTLKIEVRSVEDMAENAIKAIESDCHIPYASLTFITPELLQEVLTENRRQILQQLCGAAPMSIQNLANLLARDIKAVDDDVDALLDAGVADRKRGGNISFPYDEIIYPALDSDGRCRFRC